MKGLPPHRVFAWSQPVAAIKIQFISKNIKMNIAHHIKKITHTAITKRHLKTRSNEKQQKYRSISRKLHGDHHWTVNSNTTEKQSHHNINHEGLWAMSPLTFLPSSSSSSSSSSLSASISVRIKFHFTNHLSSFWNECVCGLGQNAKIQQSSPIKTFLSLKSS